MIEDEWVADEGDGTSCSRLSGRSRKQKEEMFQSTHLTVWSERMGLDESEFGDNHPLASPVPILSKGFSLEEETQPIHPVFTFLLATHSQSNRGNAFSEGRVMEIIKMIISNIWLFIIILSSL